MLSTALIFSYAGKAKLLLCFKTLSFTKDTKFKVIKTTAQHCVVFN